MCALSPRSYGLVRVRENAESIAFYGGEDNEARLLNSRLQGAVDNFLGGLVVYFGLLALQLACPAANEVLGSVRRGGPAGLGSSWLAVPASTHKAAERSGAAGVAALLECGPQG